MKYIILSLLFLSCKTDKNKDLVKTRKNNFEIFIDAIVPIDDVFEVFYLDEEDIVKTVRFKEEKKILKKIIGSEKMQRIVFRLPQNARLNQFRIDLGNNKNQQEITIKSITLSFRNNNILIDNDLIGIFFSLNKFIDFNDVESKIKLKNIAKKRDPFIISKPILIKKIQLEL